jgi:drug/metabolite transporter (DMT)-like permease
MIEHYLSRIENITLLFRLASTIVIVIAVLCFRMKRKIWTMCAFSCGGILGYMLAILESTVHIRLQQSESISCILLFTSLTCWATIIGGFLEIAIRRFPRTFFWLPVGGIVFSYIFLIYVWVVRLLPGAA